VTRAQAPAQTPAVRVLVVDDEPSMRDMLRIVLRKDGYDVTVAANGREAIAAMEHGLFDLLMTDIRLPDIDGVQVLREAKARHHDIVALMMTAYASTETAVEAMRLGASDYFIKPFNVDELRLKVRHYMESRRLRTENVLLKRAMETSHAFDNLIGRSPAMLEIFSMVETIAPTPSTVLVTGESGTGKDLIARAIHAHSLRKDHPFVALNCGAVPETLLESELFGHMRGAFTGADSNRKGLIEAAERGTVFLDEIGEMNQTMQVKLLRVLQERRFRRLGGTDEVLADIRVIAATNQDLQKAVAEGRFREDLFYRINVIQIHLPPLRDRREDIPLIAARFLDRFAERMGKPVRRVSQEAMALIEAYGWPGNVRELENAIERAVAVERTEAILPESLPPNVRAGGEREPVQAVAARPDGAFDLDAHVDQIYREHITEALARAGGVQVRAAEMLGMTFRSFRYYAKKFNLR
jgi:two-component system response regulator PilR (NtrC family)